MSMRDPTNCPLCGHEAADALPFYYDWQGQRFNLARCRDCGHTSIRPLPTPELIASFYDQTYFESGVHGLDRDGATYHDRYDAMLGELEVFVREELLSRHAGAHSLFEIGAATGHLLHAAGKAGVERVGGLEISADAVAHAAEAFGLDLGCANVDEVDFADFAGGWDIVYAGDVLEHVRDPDRLVAFARHLVADDGVVVMRVPATFELLSTRVASRVLPLLGRSLRLPDAPYHLHEFTARTVRALCGRHFDAVEVDVDIVPPTDLNLKGLRPQYLAKLALHLPNYPLTKLFGVCGDRLTVAAWRPR